MLSKKSQSCLVQLLIIVGLLGLLGLVIVLILVSPALEVNDERSLIVPKSAYASYGGVAVYGIRTNTEPVIKAAPERKPEPEKNQQPISDHLSRMAAVIIAAALIFVIVLMVVAKIRSGETP